MVRLASLPALASVALASFPTDCNDEFVKFKDTLFVDFISNLEEVSKALTEPASSTHVLNDAAHRTITTLGEHIDCSGTARNTASQAVNLLDLLDTEAEDEIKLGMLGNPLVEKLAFGIDSLRALMDSLHPVPLFDLQSGSKSMREVVRAIKHANECISPMDEIRAYLNPEDLRRWTKTSGLMPVEALFDLCRTNLFRSLTVKPKGCIDPDEMLGGSSFTHMSLINDGGCYGRFSTSNEELALTSLERVELMVEYAEQLRRAVLRATDEANENNLRIGCKDKNVYAARELAYMLVNHGKRIKDSPTAEEVAISLAKFADADRVAAMESLIGALFIRHNFVMHAKREMSIAVQNDTPKKEKVIRLLNEDLKITLLRVEDAIMELATTMECEDRIDFHNDHPSENEDTDEPREPHSNAVDLIYHPLKEQVMLQITLLGKLFKGWYFGDFSAAAEAAEADQYGPHGALQGAFVLKLHTPSVREAYDAMMEHNKSMPSDDERVPTPETEDADVDIFDEDEINVRM